MYLEDLNLNSNIKNIKLILRRHPLEKCFFQTLGWDSVTEMIDNFLIYPHRKTNVNLPLIEFL